MIRKARAGLWSAIFSIAIMASTATVAEPIYRVSGPVGHDNLAIYFIHGNNHNSLAPLTLSEALADGTVKIHETGNVTELAIENKGAEPVFVQSGDVVRGGKQDRVLTVSLLLPANSGRVPIASYCVEQGRWTKRGKESVHYFTSSTNAMPSKRAKLAMKLVPPQETGRLASGGMPQAQLQALTSNRIATVDTRQNDTSHPVAAASQPPPLSRNTQSVVWESVAATQQQLSENLRTRVEATGSRSSLALSLENPHLKQAIAAYVQKLEPAADAHDDILGYAFAINGRINSADIYPSHGLFKKMWPKLLRASVTEAISEKTEDKIAHSPKPDDILEFLKEAETGKPSTRPINNGAVLQINTSEMSYLFATKLKDGNWIHRNYIAQ
ncbi:MAG: DUF6569 family protein [Pseudomonadota bacterium]